jgi:hypothetical protein
MRAPQRAVAVAVATPAPASEALPEEAPATLREERYRVERVLGEGALGRTYLATDTAQGGQVAIKELQPGRLKTWKDLDLFEREAATLRGLRHPGVPRYIDHFELELDGVPRYYLVQEFIDGTTLEAELESATVLSEEVVRELAAQVLEILDYLHSLNPPVIHRDIKPANLMRRRDGTLALIDFGAVREVLDASDSEAGSTLVGTFGYMPPEQYAGQAHRQTDLFALGATCAHLLTGVAPERMFGELFHIEIPADVRLSLGMRQWLRRLLEPDLGRRYATAADARLDLREAFLMQTWGSARSGMQLAPWPGRPPRGPAGFHLREASRGQSHLFMIALSIFAAVVTLALPVTAFAVGAPVWALLGIPVALGATTIAGGRIRASQRALQLYPIAEYTIGEVTGAWLGENASGGGVNLGSRFLQYRYMVDGRYYTGHLATRQKQLRSLRHGDPIALLYDPEQPEAHQVYVV